MVINLADAAFTYNAFSVILAEALVKDKEVGTFVVRDSTSYRGSFGLALKVDPEPPGRL